MTFNRVIYPPRPVRVRVHPDDVWVEGSAVWLRDGKVLVRTTMTDETLFDTWYYPVEIHWLDTNVRWTPPTASSRGCR